MEKVRLSMAKTIAFHHLSGINWPHLSLRDNAIMSRLGFQSRKVPIRGFGRLGGTMLEVLLLAIMLINNESPRSKMIEYNKISYPILQTSRIPSFQHDFSPTRNL